MRDKPTVMIVHETVTQSIVKDTFSTVAALVMVGIGVWAGSSALEWVGALACLLMMFAWASHKSHNVTPQEAADRLYRNFGVVAQAKWEER